MGLGKTLMAIGLIDMYPSKINHKVKKVYIDSENNDIVIKKL